MIKDRRKNGRRRLGVRVVRLGGGELPVIEACIDATRLQKLLMRALLDDAPVFHDHDQVCADDRGEAMRDHHGRAIAHQALQCLLNDLLGLTVQRRRRLVQKEDRCILDHGARDAETLALTTGQGMA